MNAKFGFLEVIDNISLFTNRAKVNCVCICGKKKQIRKASLIYGKTKSCGCQRKLTISHGHSNHPIYALWGFIKQRCYNKNLDSYKWYGGRGITLCDEWHDFETFYNWAISNGWQKGLQIDRKNNDLHYSPDNCHFVTAKQNCRNRSSTKLTIKQIEEIRNLTGFTQVEMANMYKVSKSLIHKIRSQHG